MMTKYPYFPDLPKLLRAMARGTNAIEAGHDVILNSAAETIEEMKEMTDHMDQMMTMLEHENAVLKATQKGEQGRTA